MSSSRTSGKEARAVCWSSRPTSRGRRYALVTSSCALMAPRPPCNRSVKRWTPAPRRSSFCDVADRWSSPSTGDGDLVLPLWMRGCTRGAGMPVPRRLRRVVNPFDVMDERHVLVNVRAPRGDIVYVKILLRERYRESLAQAIAHSMNEQRL